MKVEILNEYYSGDCSLYYTTKVPINTKIREFIDYCKEISIEARSVTIHIYYNAHSFYEIEIIKGVIKKNELPEEYYNKTFNHEIPSNDGWGMISFYIFFGKNWA